MEIPRAVTIFIIVAFVKLLWLATCFGESRNLLTHVEEFINKTQNYKAPKNNDAFFIPQHTFNHSIDFGTYDFIIIGAGTAGGVLANRLTEERFTVLVVEAGKEEPLESSISGLFGLFFNSEWNWGYNTVPQKHSCLGGKEQRCIYPRGKSLGGSSAINAGFYIRGHAQDYDRWEALGNVGWSYRDCLPYFKKSERAEFNIDIETEFHGFGGPQSINVVNDTPNLTTVLIGAFNELGLEERDYNGHYQQGVSRVQSYLDNNIRASTAHSFIRPALNRPNLNITLQSLVTKIEISQTRARGVSFFKHGKKYFAKARKEVIVSAGAINSPQVLMLSGIGPSNELRKHNIQIKVDLPVGENLYDHVMFIPLIYRTNYEFYNNTLAENVELWQQTKRPLINGAQIETISFWNLKGNKTNRPDFSMYAAGNVRTLLSSFGFKDEYLEAFKEIDNFMDICVATGLLHPKSSGRVILKSKSPTDFPLIDTNYFSDISDLETLYQAIQFVLKLNNTENFKTWKTKFHMIPLPHCDSKFQTMSREWWYCRIRDLAVTLFHPVGTTRMGTDPRNSVVNPELKVHGIKNVRVVDAGIIPEHISGHPNAAVVMIAEKIADTIKVQHSHIPK